MPITLIARQQGWTKREVARAALIAGLGHTGSTLLIGLVVWLAGVAFATKFGDAVSAVSSLALIAFGGWIAGSSLRELQGGGQRHRHAHRHHRDHEPKLGFHGPELARIRADPGPLELSIFETGQPAHFRLSGQLGDRVWLETHRADGSTKRFEFANHGDYWQSLDEIPEPHAFAVTVSVADGDHVHSYGTTFAEHDHDRGEPVRASNDRLYAPSPAGTTVLAKHAHAHRHGRLLHAHLHDHGPDTWHCDAAVTLTDPPEHEHRHRRSFRTTLLLILGSSPMVEGIPAFFAAGKYGAGLIAAMALVFAAATITTYVALCVTSVAGLQRISLGPLERYGEVLSGTFIALVGLAFLFFPVL